MIVKKLSKEKVIQIELLFNEQKNCFYGYACYFWTNTKIIVSGNGFDIGVVYTQPPESNRGHKLNKSPVHIMSKI